MTHAQNGVPHAHASDGLPMYPRGWQTLQGVQQLPGQQSRSMSLCLKPTPASAMSARGLVWSPCWMPRKFRPGPGRLRRPGSLLDANPVSRSMSLAPPRLSAASPNNRQVWRALILYPASPNNRLVRRPLSLCPASSWSGYP